MTVKKTGISPDLLIHPGETIADVLENRGITQAELAARTGVTPTYISNVISGKKDISSNFAMSLEYALGVSKSFWLNLQANYDAELLEYNQERTITDEEKNVRARLSEIIRYLRSLYQLPEKQSISDSIISLRNLLQVSNLCNLKDLVSTGVFRLAGNAKIDPYILGAWLRICQINKREIYERQFDIDNVPNLVSELKQIMLNNKCNLQHELSKTMMEYGIDFSVVRNFRGAPVQGYISQKAEKQYQMALTIRGAFADIFWFSLFHELGHIVNGDIAKSQKFIDLVGSIKTNREIEADRFAQDALIDASAYQLFICNNDYSIASINRFAKSQKVMPYIVIGRLQREERIPYSKFSNHKLRYKWAE